MALLIVLGVVVLTTFFVLGFLFFTLDKEGRKEEEKAVPLRDVLQLRRELSDTPPEGHIPPEPQIPSEPQIPKAADESKIMPQYSPTEDVYKKRAQELEEELLAVSKKTEDQMALARQTIEDLTKDNEALKNQQADLIRAQEKIVELQKETDHWHTENSTLREQLDSSVVKVRFLEQELSAVKTQMGGQVAQANAMVADLNLQKESWVAALKPEPQAEGLHQELEALKLEQTQLKQNLADVEAVNQKLRAINTGLTQDIDALQYELIKARAQSTGLERIGFNYKNQLEDFFKKIHETQLMNEKLSEAKNSLEGVVHQVQSHNDELVKKDRLVQFELEKNRSQLINLEREYEGLKARVQSKNTQ